jgi:hypothetical protein
MPEAPRSPAEGSADRSAERSAELRREAYTMALYVSVCLLAALTAVEERADPEHVDVLVLVWGTTVGLALAHWFAFRLSARLVAAGRLPRREAAIAGAQVAGALAVATLATAPVIVLPATAELDVVRLVLAGFVAAVAVAVARSGGASTARSLVYAVAVLATAAAVALLKNVLGGH